MNLEIFKIFNHFFDVAHPPYIVEILKTVILKTVMIA